MKKELRKMVDTLYQKTCNAEIEWRYEYCDYSYTYTTNYKNIRFNLSGERLECRFYQDGYTQLLVLTCKDSKKIYKLYRFLTDRLIIEQELRAEQKKKSLCDKMLELFNK